MSFAMDDLSRSYGVDPALQSRLIEETRTIEKTADAKSSDSVPKEPEVNDVFETLQQKPKNSFEEIQKESTAIDIKKDTLGKIASHVEDIKKTIKSDNQEYDSKQKIDENYEKIQQAAKEKVSLEEIKVSDIKNLEINTPEQKKESVEKLNGILNNIKDKEQVLTEQQDKLVQKVNNSLIELKIGASNTSETEIQIKIQKDITKQEQISAEKLKDSTIKSIHEAPEKSIKMHVRHLDKNLLLAMLSLKSA